ncbi:MAG TPA: cation:proton antiporter [Clostridia bacterium]|nr:cation:proton antiporter [Clostridia bacterium]
MLGWFFSVGLVLCAMAIASTLIQRLPLSTAMLYLPLGWALGPNGISAVNLHIVRDAAIIEQATQVVILISLFSAGLKMRIPLTSRLWLLSFRLAFLSMVLTVALIAVAGVILFGLPWGFAILIGGMLAPTDPVLASDVQVEDPYHLGAVRFGLTSEAGLNDGSAFPFVILGLMLLTGPFGPAAGLRWLLLDVCWGVVAGVAGGFVVAMLVGNYILHLRRIHHQAFGLGYFLAPGLIALSFAFGSLLHGYGFLSVFTSAVTLRWIEMNESKIGEVPRLPLVSTDRAIQFEAATNADTAPLFLVEVLLQFTSQLEQIGELVIVVIVGALLTRQAFTLDAVLPLLLLFLVIRPVAIFAGLAGSRLGFAARGLIAWFRIRGIGSLYYLAYAIQRGLPVSSVPWVANNVLAAIAMSVVLHGITVTPIMNWCSARPRVGMQIRT